MKEKGTNKIEIPKLQKNQKFFPKFEGKKRTTTTEETDDSGQEQSGSFGRQSQADESKTQNYSSFFTWLIATFLLSKIH